MYETYLELLQFIVPGLIIIIGLCIHAFVDAERKKRETEILYNKQPRVKPLNKKLAWSGRILNAVLLRRFN